MSMTVVPDAAIVLDQPRRDTAPADRTPPDIARKSRLRSAATGIGLGVVGFAVLVGVWAAISSWKPAVPSPSTTLDQMRELLKDPFHDGAGSDKGIGIQLRGTLGRVFKGFGLAALVGVPFGLLIGAWRPAFRAANPVIQLLRPVSPSRGTRSG